MKIDDKNLPGLKAYKVKGVREWLITLPDSDTSHRSHRGDRLVDAICCALEANPRSLGNNPVSANYLQESCSPTTWPKIPPAWQNVFKQFINLNYEEDVAREKAMHAAEKALDVVEAAKQNDDVKRLKPL